MFVHERTHTNTLVHIIVTHTHTFTLTLLSSHTHTHINPLKLTHTHTCTRRPRSQSIYSLLLSHPGLSFLQDPRSSGQPLGARGKSVPPFTQCFTVDVTPGHLWSGMNM